MFSQHSLVDPMAKINRLISLFALLLTKANVDGLSLKAFQSTLAATITKWEGRRLAQSLGHFNAAPGTLLEEITSKKEKRDAKKEAKHLKTDHLSNDQHTGGQQPNG